MEDLKEKMLQDYNRASERFLMEIKKDPEKAKDFLLRAGIMIRSATDPKDIELAPQFR